MDVRIARTILNPAVPRQSRILSAMEYFFACPYCWERISMVLDTSVKAQTYVEDCEVCCHPIEVRYTVEDDEVSAFEARALE
jgi:transcription elongation factor Elf1